MGPPRRAWLSANGNFVITEIEVDAAPVADAKQKTRHPIASGKASFSQGGFDPAATFNGNARDQGGWAVHPRGGIVQWVTYQFAQPIDYEGGVELTFAIHQYHNAEGHRLGRFRISVTTDQAEIQLGLPEEFLAAQSISAAARTEDNVKSLLTYVEKRTPGGMNSGPPWPARGAAGPSGPAADRTAEIDCRIGKADGR